VRCLHTRSTAVFKDTRSIANFKEIQFFLQFGGKLATVSVTFFFSLAENQQVKK
jgi:hypothetical protein